MLRIYLRLIVLLALASWPAHGGVFYVEAGGAPPAAYCTTVPSSGLAFCDDFEEGNACTTASREPEWTSSGDDFDCTESTSPIAGTYSLRILSGAPNEDLYCAGGASNCAGTDDIGDPDSACWKFHIRVDDEGTSSAGDEDVLIPRTSGDGQAGPSFYLNTTGTDFTFVAGDNGDTLVSTLSQEYILCLQESPGDFEAYWFSDSDCGTDLGPGDIGPSFETPSGFRVRSNPDNADIYIDNLTLHNGACQTVWSGF